jgi:hypothetical protein
MARRTVKAKELVEGVRAGVPADQLASKFGITEQNLRTLLTKLVGMGALDRAAVASCFSPNRTGVEDSWKCPACGKTEPQAHDECPSCGVVVSKYTGNRARPARLDGSDHGGAQEVAVPPSTPASSARRAADDDDWDGKPSGGRRFVGHIIGCVVGIAVGWWFTFAMARYSLRHHTDFYDKLGIVGGILILVNLWLGIQDLFAHGSAGRIWRWMLALDASLVISVLCGSIVMAFGFSQTTASVVGVLFGLSAMAPLTLALKCEGPFPPGSKTREDPTSKKEGS